MNAYEIRLDILKMAQGLVSEKYYQKRDTLQAADDRAQNQWHESCRDTRSTMESSHAYVNGKTIEKLYPTSDEIIAQADELYQFVADE